MFTSDYLVIETRFSAVSSVLRPFYENNFSNFQIRRMEARRKCSVLLQELQERPFDLRVPEFRYVPAPPKMPPSTPIPPCPPNSRKCTPPTRADVPTDVQQKY
ncbi:hypothetical protein HMI55_006816 [Coelomomyces lativittatus]|nr:hypothetical protein HMI55_006816 [Coelomomyces lativittatus]